MDVSFPITKVLTFPGRHTKPKQGVSVNNRKYRVMSVMNT